jgi:hypothetical protein
LIIGSILPSESDAKLIEFTYKFTEVGFNYMIPIPTHTIRASSVIDQFQSWVNSSKMLRIKDTIFDYAVLGLVMADGIDLVYYFSVLFLELVSNS